MRNTDRARNKHNTADSKQRRQRKTTDQGRQNPTETQTATEAPVFENKQQTPSNSELQVVTNTKPQANNDLSTMDATRSKTNARKKKKRKTQPTNDELFNSPTTATVNANETNKC